MDLFSRLWALVAGAVIIAVAGVSLAPTPHSEAPQITAAIGVISPCGIYAVITIQSDGSAVVYDSTNEAPPSVEKTVTELKQEQRHAIIVPCPAGVNFGQEKEAAYTEAPHRRGHDAL
jgi:hypothetical protein